MPAPTKIVLTITATADVSGKVAIDVTGPVDNEMLALWLIEKGKDAIKARNAAPASPIAVVRNGVPVA